MDELGIGFHLGILFDELIHFCFDGFEASLEGAAFGRQLLSNERGLVGFLEAVAAGEKFGAFVAVVGGEFFEFSEPGAGKVPGDGAIGDAVEGQDAGVDAVGLVAQSEASVLAARGTSLALPY